MAVSSGLLAAAPERTFDRFVSQPAVASSADYAAAHPGARILADDVTGSQLLWRYPSLAGRVGFDARTEVYRPADFLRFARFLTVSGSSWTAATRGYQVVAVTCSLHPNLCAALKGLAGWRVISQRRRRARRRRLIVSDPAGALHRRAGAPVRCPPTTTP